MTILDTIIQSKRKDVELRKALTPVQKLETSVHFPSPTVSLSEYVLREDKIGIIAEIKRRSPSKGIINENISVERLSIGYMQAGASALSIITDKEFFGGTDRDLETARKFNYCPILRKDFIVDEYQIIESKAIGADAILLIGEVLSKAQLSQFSQLAASLGLEVLLEVHTLEALPDNLDHVSLLGVNNRNLSSFDVAFERAEQLAASLPPGPVRVAESGISDATVAKRLYDAGFRGFLIGEHFMRSSRPEEACAQFVVQLRALISDESTSRHTEASR